jgi:hypothetical protein
MHALEAEGMEVFPSVKRLVWPLLVPTVQGPVFLRNLPNPPD